MKANSLALRLRSLSSRCVGRLRAKGKMTMSLVSLTAFSSLEPAQKPLRDRRDDGLVGRQGQSSLAVLRGCTPNQVSWLAASRKRRCGNDVDTETPIIGVKIAIQSPTNSTIWISVEIGEDLLGRHINSQNLVWLTMLKRSAGATAKNSAYNSNAQKSHQHHQSISPSSRNTHCRKQSYRPARR